LGYSNQTLIETILAQALTSGTPSSTGSPVDLLKIGNTLENTIPTAVVDQYIQFADQQIDASLNELYVTPLCEKANFETRLLSDISDYNDLVIATNTCPFYPGDVIILTDGTNEDRFTITEVIDVNDRNVFQVTPPISYSFSALNTRMIRIAYPEPIPLTSARLSAANIYEKYFMSQSSPNESDYGKLLRKLARQDINNILNGRTVLHGAKRIGRRFYNPTLVDRYDLPNSQKGDNNIDDLG
jgi:hypothetical protein